MKIYNHGLSQIIILLAMLNVKRERMLHMESCLLTFTFMEHVIIGMYSQMQS